MNVLIKKLHPDAVLPKYATPGSAGFDLVAIEDVIIGPDETKLVKTGLAFQIPEGYELQVRPRSGTSLKTPLRVANAPGTVDSDYRGEVCVIMTNTRNPIFQDRAFDPEYHSSLKLLTSQKIKKGDRIAQGVICPIIQAEFEEVDDLSATARGAGGFGSTGA